MAPIDNQMLNSGDPGIRAVARQLPPSVHPAATQTEDDDSQPNLLIIYARTILRHKFKILGCCIFGAVLGFASTLTAPATYRVRTSLDVQSINEDFMNIRAVDPTQRTGTSTETVLQTEIKLLQSETLLDRVVAKLTPAPPGSPSYSAPEVPWIANVLHIRPHAPATREALLRELAAHASVKPIGMTRLIEVGCESTDRALAVQFCNSLVDEFLLQDQENQWSKSKETIDYLSSQLTKVRTTLQDSERKLQEFKQQNQMLFTGDRESVAQSKLRNMQSGTTQAEADRAAREVQYKMGMSVRPDTLPAVLDDEPSKQYQMELGKLERNRADLATVFTPDAPELKKIDVQIATLRQTIQQTRINLVERLRNEYDAASAREKALTEAYRQQESLVSNQLGKTVQLNMLEREAESGRQIYTVLLQRVKEAGFASAMKSNPIRIVDRATAPVTPFGPRRMVNSAVGLMCGLFGGVLIAFFRTRSDRSFRMPGDAGKYLSLREFGVIPSATALALSDESHRGLLKRLFRGSKSRGVLPPAKGTLNSRPALELVTWTRKRSLMAEAYRAAMSSVLYSARGEQMKSLVMSSPTMGEGKTTLLSNLGIAFAEAGRRVILIDADLRRPRLHTIFDIGNNSGLQQALRGENEPAVCPIGLLAHETFVPNLFVLPSGSGSEDASLLLHSPRLPILLKRLEQEFDIVLIDSPPMLHLPDARAIAQYTKGMMLVLRAGVATRQSASAASRLLKGDQTPILGVFLNDFSPEREAIRGYYRDYYKYQKISA